MLYVEPAGWDMSVRENPGSLFKRSCSIEVVKSLDYIHTYLELHISRLHMKYAKTFSPHRRHTYVCTHPCRDRKTTCCPVLKRKPPIITYYIPIIAYIRASKQASMSVSEINTGRKQTESPQAAPLTPLSLSPSLLPSLSSLQCEK